MSKPSKSSLQDPEVLAPVLLDKVFGEIHQNFVFGSMPTEGDIIRFWRSKLQSLRDGKPKVCKDKKKSTSAEVPKATSASA